MKRLKAESGPSKTEKPSHKSSSAHQRDTLTQEHSEFQGCEGQETTMDSTSQLKRERSIADSWPKCVRNCACARALSIQRH